MRMNPPGKRKTLVVAPTEGRRRKGEHAPGRRALLRARSRGATFVSVTWERTAAQRLGRAARCRVKPDQRPQHAFHRAGAASPAATGGSSAGREAVRVALRAGTPGSDATTRRHRTNRVECAPQPGNSPAACAAGGGLWIRKALPQDCSYGRRSIKNTVNGRVKSSALRRHTGAPVAGVAGAPFAVYVTFVPLTTESTAKLPLYSG